MSKERLVELISDYPCMSTAEESFMESIADDLADYLLANGVIVPPLKIGQELWDIHYNKPRKWEVVYLGYNGKEWHINIHWWKDRHNFKTVSITYPFVGKMWYLTREEAEAKLKEGESE
jgi:hypothetical protein